MQPPHRPATSGGGPALLIIFALLSAVLGSGCTRDTAWRTEPPADCDPQANCDNAYIEHHDHFSLGFVEFSERGNEFSRKRTRQVIEQIQDHSNSPGGVAMVIFVHGWLHNASPSDANVHSFRQVLSKIGRSGIVGDRKLFGVYVGWRGKSLHGLGSEYLTYWGRKLVAEHVGYNGVTPLLLKLANVDAERKDNILLIAGHSFGGAMTLSAVDDVLLTRMNEALHKNEPARPIAEGVVLLNPAIEANQIFALKSHSLRLGQIEREQRKLLHVISSKGDMATHVYFPIGQTLGSLGWAETDFTRDYLDNTYTFEEDNLDTATIGNYQRFWTGSLTLKRDDKVGPFDEPVGEWRFHDLCGHERQNHNPAEARLPCTTRDPLMFLTTDASFIADHGDIFNNRVSAYMTAIVAASMYTESQVLSTECAREGEFSFGTCFEYFLDRFRELNAPGSGLQ